MPDHFGIIGTELEWFKSYLTNREQQCTINGQISSPKKTVCAWNPAGFDLEAVAVSTIYKRYA
jgi:outer membrane translocation and assembly module TamA